MNQANQTPGLVVLLGSGETLPSSGKTHEFVAQRSAENPCIVILETPAGFEPNSAAVAGKIKTYLEKRLQNYAPDISVLPARKRGTEFSPDNPNIVAPILMADEILLGPGSPTYAARQLRNSLASQMIAARHRTGATVFLSSSATLAFSRFTMPVYEIYKVGQDLHWQDGVNFLAPFGLNLVVIPHWNNKDGGSDLDTSRCYLGQNRFNQLREMLPAGQTIVGIDEHTSLVIDFSAENVQVMGNGSVTILQDGAETVLQSGESQTLDVLGAWQIPQANDDIPQEIWVQAESALERKAAEKAAANTPSDQVLALVEQRTAARTAKNWQLSDELRDQIADLGWVVRDTKDGAELERL